MAQTLTAAQTEALEEGGLSQGCVDNHLDAVCLHCGACQRCSSGCDCAEAEDAPDYWQDGYDAAQAAYEANELRPEPPAGAMGELEALPHQRADAERQFRAGWVALAESVSPHGQVGA